MDERRIPNDPSRETLAPKRADPIRGAASTKPRKQSSDSLPSAGPHAQEDLVEKDRTPGTGALTPPGDQDEVDAASG
jgi:hypothetical protein